MYELSDFLEENDSDASASFARAFQTISAEGGGELRVAPGEYLCGPLDLPSNLVLTLTKNATIRFIPDFSLYKPVWTRWEGVECWAAHPLIFANAKENIRIRGEGTFDGSGEQWWKALRSRRELGPREPVEAWELELAALNPDYKTQAGGGGGREMQFLRPPLLSFYKCTNIQVSGVTLQNSPFWNTHPVYSGDMLFDGVTFRNPADAPNTDGLDLDSCNNVRIENCTFDVGDDCLAIKSGSGPDGIRVGIPSKKIYVKNCKFLAGHGGVVIGSETAAGISDVKVEDCLMINTDRAVRLKTRRGRGGELRRLEFLNIEVRGTKCPVVINSYYRCGADPGDTKLFALDAQDLQSTTPSIVDVSIRGLRASGVRAAAGFIAGLPEAPVRNLLLEDIDIQMAAPEDREPESEAAMYAGLANSSHRGIRIVFAKEPKLGTVSVSGLEPGQEALNWG